MKTINIFKSAPLPFQGQKRRFVKEFETTLKEFSCNGEITTIVDLFGGSGLLSHTAKRTLPQCRVIYNDYDGYSKRLQNIDRTNSLLVEIRKILIDIPMEKKVDTEKKQVICKIVDEAEKTGFVDYITLSSSLLFSNNYVKSYNQFIKQPFYNNCVKDDYSDAGYLDGLEIVCLDYKDLFERYKDLKEVLFIADPPYMLTDCSSYSICWKIKEHLDVLNTLKDSKFIYFTYDKSQIIELYEWLVENYENPTSLADFTIKSVKGKGRAANYKEIMLYKNNNVSRNY